MDQITTAEKQCESGEKNQKPGRPLSQTTHQTTQKKSINGVQTGRRPVKLAHCAAGECLARPLPDASDLTWCSRAPPAPLAGRCVLRQRARHHPLLGAQQAPHLQRLGAAVRRPMPLSEVAKRQCGVGRPCGRGCGAQTPGYARCAALLRDSRCTRVRRLYEKVARFGEIVYG